MAQNIKGKKAAKKPSAAKPKKGTAAKTAAGAKKPKASSAAGARKTAAKQTAAKTGSGSAKAQPKVKALSGEVRGIMLIAVGLFLAFAFFWDATGIVGEFICSVCYGLFGAASALFSLYFIIIGIKCIADKKQNDMLGMWLSLLGLMLCTAMIYALLHDDIRFVHGGLWTNIKDLYNNGINLIGGGIIGGLLCKVIVFLIGSMGAWVFTIAALLVFIMLLVDVSVEKIFRKLVNFIRQSKNSMAERAGREIEIDPIESAGGQAEDASAESKRRKRPSLFKRLFGGRNKTAAAADDFIEPHMDEVDFETLPHTTDLNSISPNVPHRRAESTPTKPQRFVYEEDSSILDDIVGGKADDESKKFSLDDLPFDLDDIETGVITEVTDDFSDIQVPLFEKKPPETSEQNGGLFGDIDIPEFLDTAKTGALTEIPNEDGTIPEKPDPDFFEPPSEAKMNDRLDAVTKAALDSGVPLDEAIVRGRKMAAEGELSPEEIIQEQVSEHNAAPKIIQYKLPDLSLLSKPKPKTKTPLEIRQELEDKANRLLSTLRSFKVDAKIINITQGPSVTRFELQPGVGIKVSKITGLSDDIALSLAAPGVRIEAPIPGKSAIGIEIPNAHPTAVPIREVIDTAEFRKGKSTTTVALGKDISGECVIADISDFPHILIAGATGSGKSVCINSLITSILYKAKPDEIKMIMIDPKMVELGVYNGIPHLLIPVVTDPKHAAGALNWAVVEMQNRYNLLKDNKVRNLDGYNRLMEENGEPDAKLPEIVIIIDELADLMTVAKSEVEEAINRLAALARAAGMYLIIATQRPSVNVITGVIKANIPSRIAFAVSSQIDSRTIIDSAGAEKLLGKGDMLYSPRGSMKPMRVQGNFVSDSEIEAIVSYIKSQYEAEYDEEVIEHIEKEHERVSADIEASNAAAGGHSQSGSSGRIDDMFLEAVELVLENGQASVAMFQRKFKMGYQRAAKLIDQMEEMNIIGPYEGTKPRQVKITRQEFNEMKYNRDNG